MSIIQTEPNTQKFSPQHAMTREQARSRAWQIAEATLLRERVVRTLPMNSSAIALTFDDGPHPNYTPRVLEALRAADIRATFFLVGERAEQYPELVRQIVHEGHTIGCHTQTHVDLTKIPFARVWQECIRSRRGLEKITGTQIRWFRPPMGWLKVVSSPAVVLNGMKLVYWNQDSLDYTGIRAEEITETVKGMSLSAGDILLLHDDRPATAEALPGVLEHVRLFSPLPLDTVYPIR